MTLTRPHTLGNLGTWAMMPQYATILVAYDSYPNSYPISIAVSPGFGGASGAFDQLGQELSVTVSDSDRLAGSITGCGNWNTSEVSKGSRDVKGCQGMSRDVKGCQGAGVRLNMGVWLACAWYFGSLERGPCGWSAVRDMLHMLAYAQQGGVGGLITSELVAVELNFPRSKRK